jgi:hypothetical protein
MANLAQTLRQVGYVTPQGQVTGPNAPLAQQLKNYVTNVIPTAAQNLAQQRSDIDAALTMGQGGVQIGDREAFERQMAQVPYVLGSISNLSAAERMKIAQANAALPVKQGGLGLPPNNTPMQRAEAMGFDTPAYHGTRIDFTEFQPKSWFSSDPKYASDYSNVLMKVEPQNPTQQVFPVLTKITKPHKVQYFGSESDMNKVLDAGKKETYVIENVGGGNSKHYVIKDPKNIRSIFAAFDPKRRKEADILAGAMAIPMATNEENRRAILEKLFNEQQK